MKIFVDTNFWVAKIHRDDQWHEAAIDAEYRIALAELVTTPAVLIETLNYFSSFRNAVKTQAAEAVRTILASDDVTVIGQGEDLILAAIDLFEKRSDKGYSLTDCISMVVMRYNAITQVLSHDQHFTQEGFTTLL